MQQEKLYKCPTCKQLFPRDLVYIKKYTKKNGEISEIVCRCKQCAKIASKESASRRKEEVREYHKKWYKEHHIPALKRPKKFKNSSQYNDFYLYHITPEEKAKLPKYCEVCGATIETDRLCIDHSHTTGKIRGVLCHNCNTALGLLKDNPVRIEKLLEYIKQRN